MQLPTSLFQPVSLLQVGGLTTTPAGFCSTKHDKLLICLHFMFEFIADDFDHDGIVEEAKTRIEVVTKDARGKLKLQPLEEEED